MCPYRCWVNGTFHSSEMDENDIEYDQGKIVYYQWIVFIIIFQCFLFTLPSHLWSLLVYLNGFNMEHVTKNILPKLYLDEYVNERDWSSTQRVIRSICDHLKVSFLDESAARRRHYFREAQANMFAANKTALELEPNKKHTKKKKTSSKKHEHQHLLASQRSRYPTFRTKSYTFPLFYPYLLTKAAYLLVVVANFAFLTWTFNFNYMEFGWRALLILSRSNNGAPEGMDTQRLDAEYFPKRAFCTIKFYSKKYANQGSYFCTLPINLFNQVFYLGFWFWLWIIAALTVCSAVHWLYVVTLRSRRRRYVMDCIGLSTAEQFSKSFTAAYYLTRGYPSLHLICFHFIITH